MQSSTFTLKPWPPVRNLIAEHVSIARQVNQIHGMAEADITELKKILQELRKQKGEVYSLTAYFMFCMAQTLNKYKQLQSVRYKNKLLVFDDIDVLTIVERGNDKLNTVPVAIIIRKAQEKSLQEINKELRESQKNNPLEYEEVKARRKLLKYPSFIRKIILNRIQKTPLLRKKYYGTVGLTSLLSPSGNRAWWGIPLSAAPLTVLLAGMYDKVVLKADGTPETRMFMSVTFTFDHDTIDGAPARRFVTELIQNIESGYGLR